MRAQSILKKLTLFTVLFLTFEFFQNCSGVNFSSTPNTTHILAWGGDVAIAGGGTCSIAKVKSPIKVLFVVDASGSNVKETQNQGTKDCATADLSGCAPPTDPKKSFRGGSISTFFNANQASSMFSWGFLTFSGSSAQSYIMKNSMPSFGDSIAMQSAISSFGSDTDQGGTPYIAALNYAKSVVSNDSGLVASGILAPLYEIIFLSDGYPSDALMSDGSVDFPSINAAISDISNLASGRIYFSAVYYGTINDPTAANTLQNMASVGKGQFVNANTQTTSAIAINNLITIPVGDCAD